MQNEVPGDVQVSEPSPERRDEVARFLFPPHDNLAYACDSATLASDLELQAGLFEAQRGDQTVGAVWGRSRADGTAQITPPRICSREPNETAHLLLKRLQEYLSANHVCAAFAYLPSDDFRSLDLLGREGYRPAGEMLVMARAIERDAIAPAGDLLSFHHYQSSHQRRLTEVVQRTCEDTLDFPTLREIHCTGDTLGRYADTGDSGTDLWWFARLAGRDVGCLLLADHQQHDQCELVYMGLVPEARGTGLGHEVVVHAVKAAQETGRRQVILGVDAHNDPAIAVYASVGFLEQHRRSVLSKVFCPNHQCHNPCPT